VDAGVDSGADAGPVLGTLEVVVLLPVSGLNHSLRIYMQDDGPGHAVSWGNPQADFTSLNGKIDAHVAGVAQGTEIKLNGEYDPDPAHPWAHDLCMLDATVPSGARSIVPIWAKYNGQWTAPIYGRPHVPADGACDLYVVAAPSALISNLDKDGDGFTVAQGDCDDNDGSRNPGMIESWGDAIDLDCDGQFDPAQVTIRLNINVLALSPIADTFSVGGAFPMGYNAAGYYETAPIPKTMAPKKFLVHWPYNAASCQWLGGSDCYDSSFYGGSCHGDLNLVQMVTVGTNTLVPLTLQPEGSPAFTCRRVD